MLGGQGSCVGWVGGCICHSIITRTCPKRALGSSQVAPKCAIFSGLCSIEMEWVPLKDLWCLGNKSAQGCTRMSVE